MLLCQEMATAENINSSRIVLNILMGAKAYRVIKKYICFRIISCLSKNYFLMLVGGYKKKGRIPVSQSLLHRVNFTWVFKDKKRLLTHFHAPPCHILVYAVLYEVAGKCE